MPKPDTPKKFTSSGQVLTGGGILTCVTLQAGTDTATVVLYDNTEASGTELCNIAVTTSLKTLHIVFPNGRRFLKGIYASLAGTNPVVIIGIR